MIIKDAQTVFTGDIDRTLYDCGCEWSWKTHCYIDICPDHSKQTRPKDDTGRECTCLNVGEDDGATTCWQHHNCSDGSCTHQDGGDNDE